MLWHSIAESGKQVFERFGRLAASADPLADSLLIGGILCGEG